MYEQNKQRSSSPISSFKEGQRREIPRGECLVSFASREQESMKKGYMNQQLETNLNVVVHSFLRILKLSFFFLQVIF